MSEASLVSDIQKIKCILPSIKKIYVDKQTWDRLSFELQQIQRYGVNGPAQYVIEPIIVNGIEIWRAKVWKH